MEMTTEALHKLLKENPALYKALMAQVGCEQSLYKFTETMWEFVEPANPFIPSWHMEAICLHLEAVFRGDITRLLINVPPGMAKSIILSVFFPAWCWIHRPSHRFLCTSYSSGLTERDNIRFRQVITSDLYRAMWGDKFGFSRDSFNITKMGNDKTGWKIASSTEGLGTGERADVVIIDDPHNVKDGESDAARKTTLQYFNEVLPTRLTNPKTSAMVVIMQRVHECLLPNTTVSTPNGVVKSSALREGDVIMTSQGERKIKATMSRKYNGGITEIKTWGHFGTFSVTDNHPILTDSGWKAAGDLSKEDKIIFPIYKSATPMRDIKARFPEYIKRSPPKKCQTVTGERGGVDKKILESLVKSGETSSSIAKIMKVSTRQLVDAYISAFGISREVGVKVSDKIIYDESFWLMVGYWIAEGSFVENRRGNVESVVFTFARHEMKYAKDIKRAIEKYGPKVWITLEPSVIKVRFSSIQIAGFLSLFGRGAKNKFIPEWAIRLPKKYAKQLLIGYQRGDGCFNREEYLVRFGSASLGLIEGVSKMLLRFGATSSIYRNKKPKKNSVIKSGHRKGYVIRSGEGYELRVSSDSVVWMGFPKRKRAMNSSRRNLIDEDRVLIKIKSLQRKKYIGMVYDIQTPTKDFLSGYITAHNCDVSGHILSNDLGYTHLMLPMEYDPDRHCRTYVGDKVFFDDPRTEPGQLLFPARFPAWVVERDKKAIGPFAAASQFQQSPMPRGGGIIKRDYWKFWPEDDAGPLQENFNADGKPLDQKIYPEMDYIVASIDTAYSSKTEADYNALCILGLFRLRGLPKIMLMHAWQKRLDFRGDSVPRLPNETEKEWRVRKKKAWGMLEWTAYECARAKVDKLLIEGKATGITLAQEMRKVYGNDKWATQLINPKGDKVARAYSIQHIFAEGMVYAPERDWSELAISECEKFPKGAHDDLPDCFVAGTLIATKRGNVPIENIVVGDMALTPDGWRRVLVSKSTGKKKIISRFGLTGTPTHPIFQLDLSYQEMQKCSESKLVRNNLCGFLKIALLKTYGLKVSGTHSWVESVDIIYRNPQQMQDGKILKACMSLFGNLIMERRFLKAMTFITRITTLSIASLKILYAFRWASIAAWKKEITILMSRAPLSKKEEKKSMRGTVQRPALNGISNTLRMFSLKKWFLKNTFALGAVRILQQKDWLGLNIALAGVGQNMNGGNKTDTLGREKQPVRNAEENSFQKYSSEQNFAGRDAEPEAGKEAVTYVYNLQVEDAVCFFANGILVHNCLFQGIKWLRDSGWALRREEVRAEDDDKNRYVPSKQSPLYDV